MIRKNQHINKRYIQDRMRRFAANLSGVAHTELLDPVVNLMMESVSEEVYKISGEIENIENRILDKLSSILVPSIEAIAKPAHCILHVAAQEGIIGINRQTGFQYSDRKRNCQYSFYPVCKTNIYKGEVLYFIHRDSIYTIDRDISKTLFARSQQKERFEDNIFWLGLQLDETVEDLSGMSFYFDLHGIFEKYDYLNLLSYTTWNIQGEDIVMDKGIISSEEEYQSNTLELFSKYDLCYKINRSVNKYYNNHFLTVTDKYPIRDKRETFPQELKSDYSEKVINGFKKPLIWIKVTCPLGFTTNIIESLQPCINAVPVVNKKLVSKITEVKRSSPIIPLNTGRNESFISVSSVSDSMGKIYYDIPVNDSKTDRYGIYALRRGGIERYNKRDAEEYMANIIDVINNEVSSFFTNKNDIKSDSKKIELEVNRLLRQLNKKQSESTDRYEIENYLLVAPDKDKDVYFLDYWVANGEEANSIRPGAIFTSLSDILVNPVSIYSLSHTTGGKFAPQAEKKNNLYKKTLLEHSLIITDEDIQNFCKQEFKESVSEVSVSKGIMKSKNPHLGFIQTTDVYMKPAKGMENHINEKDRGYFLKKLKENSPATYNYRVFIN